MATIYVISERGGEEPDHYTTPRLWTLDESLAQQTLSRLTAISEIGMPKVKERGYYWVYVKAAPERLAAYAVVLNGKRPQDSECDWTLDAVEEITSSDEPPVSPVPSLSEPSPSRCRAA